MAESGIYSGRVPHILKGKKDCSLPSNWLFVACLSQTVYIERDKPNRTHLLDCGSAMHCRYRAGEMKLLNNIDYHNAGELWDWVHTVTSKQNPLTIVGLHIGLTCTLTGLWDELEAGRYELYSDEWRMRDLQDSRPADKRKGVLCIEDPPTIIQLWSRQSGGRINILDLRNYFPIDAGTLVVDYIGEELKSADETKSLQDKHVFCYQICKATAASINSLLGMIRELKLGSFKYTSGGIAMAGFLRSYNDTPIYIHNHYDAIRLERDACFGGRAEVFRHGETKEPITVYDVNSMYPWVMENWLFPCKLLEYIEHGSITKLFPHDKEILYIAECCVETSQNRYPVKTASGTIYPSGRYWTVLATPELAEAYGCGELVELGRVAVYRGSDLFKRWSEATSSALGHCKSTGRDGEVRTLKLLRNSLSGKFAQQTAKWIDEENEPAAMPWGMWSVKRSGERLPTFYRAVHHRVQSKGVPGEHRDSFPAIYAHITSAARMMMRYNFSCAGEENLYYTDTDSMHVNSNGVANIEHIDGAIGGDPGQLKIVAKEQPACYFGVKDYEIGERRVIGGLNVDVHTFRERQGRVWAYPRLATVLSSRSRNSVTGILERVCLRKQHVSGEVGPDGFVQPSKLGESYEDYQQRMASIHAAGHGRRTVGVNQGPWHEVFWQNNQSKRSGERVSPSV